MKILIIYKYSNHKNLIERLVIEMQQCGLKISAVNSSNFSWHGDPYSKMWLIKIFQSVTLIPKLRGFFLILFKLQILKFISVEFGLIDFHSFSSEDISFSNFLKLRNKKYTITYWGSDLLRASKNEIGKQLGSMDNSSLVRAITAEIYEKLKSLSIKTKISLCIFGVHGVDLINDLVSNRIKPEINQLPKILQQELLDKVKIIVIGNNGSESQNHLLVFDALKNYSDILHKHNILLVIPLGYSASNKYKILINNKLKEIGLKFVLIDEYLPDNHFSSLTCLTDIYITTQESDAYSFYLQEQLASGSIVLFGEWLPYKRLVEEGVQAYEISFENIGEILLKILNDFDYYKQKSDINIKLIRNASSWENRKHSWFRSYVWVANL